MSQQHAAMPPSIKLVVERRIPVPGVKVSEEIGKGHHEYNFRLQAEGKLLYIGPLTNPDGSSSGAQALYNVSSIEEAKALSSKDPLVASGARTCDFKIWSPWVFPK